MGIFNALSFRTGLIVAFLLICAITSSAQTDPVDWVNLYIGTGSGPIGYGGTMPFVTPPFGMTDWTPQTRQNKLSVVSYKYEDATISGFMGTHQPAIWMGDYGYVTVMPEVDTLKTNPEDRLHRSSACRYLARLIVKSPSSCACQPCSEVMAARSSSSRSFVARPSFTARARYLLPAATFF